MRERHLGDDVVAEPVDAALGREIVDRSRIAAGIDRTAHQGHRQRHIGIAAGLHDRHRCHDRHRRLAHRDDMHVAAERMQHLDHVVDVIVEIEAAFGERHHARVRPVGDVDFMRGQEGFHRAAQQRGVMAGHRRHDQHARLRGTQRTRQLAVEVQQAAERLLPHALDLDRRADAVDFGVVKAPLRLAVTARGALEQFAGRRDRLAELGVRPRVQRVLEQDLGRIRHGPRRIEGGLRHLVHPVHRRCQRRTTFGNERRCFAKLTNRHLISDPCFAPQHTGQRVILRQSTDRHFHGWKPEKRWRFHGKVTYSPPPSSDPCRFALRKRARNAAKDAMSRTAFRESAVSIRSARKTPSIRSARMPSKT